MDRLFHWTALILSCVVFAASAQADTFAKLNQRFDVKLKDDGTFTVNSAIVKSYALYAVDDQGNENYQGLVQPSNGIDFDVDFSNVFDDSLRLDEASLYERFVQLNLPAVGYTKTQSEITLTDSNWKNTTLRLRSAFSPATGEYELYPVISNGLVYADIVSNGLGLVANKSKSVAAFIEQLNQMIESKEELFAMLSLFSTIYDETLEMLKAAGYSDFAITRSLIKQQSTIKVLTEQLGGVLQPIDLNSYGLSGDIQTIIYNDLSGEKLTDASGVNIGQWASAATSAIANKLEQKDSEIIALQIATSIDRILAKVSKYLHVQASKASSDTVRERNRKLIWGMNIARVLINTSATVVYLHEVDAWDEDLMSTLLTTMADTINNWLIYNVEKGIFNDGCKNANSDCVNSETVLERLASNGVSLLGSKVFKESVDKTSAGAAFRTTNFVAKRLIPAAADAYFQPGVIDLPVIGGDLNRFGRSTLTMHTVLERDGQSLSKRMAVSEPVSGRSYFSTVPTDDALTINTLFEREGLFDERSAPWEFALNIPPTPIYSVLVSGPNYKAVRELCFRSIAGNITFAAVAKTARQSTMPESYLNSGCFDKGRFGQSSGVPLTDESYSLVFSSLNRLLTDDLGRWFVPSNQNGGLGLRFRLPVASSVSDHYVIVYSALDEPVTTREFEVINGVVDTDGDALPDGYEQWAADEGAETTFQIGTDDSQFDFDGDGHANLVEYIAGSDPHIASSQPAHTSVLPVGVSAEVAQAVRSVYEANISDHDGALTYFSEDAGVSVRHDNDPYYYLRHSSNSDDSGTLYLTGVANKNVQEVPQHMLYRTEKYLLDPQSRVLRQRTSSEALLELGPTQFDTREPLIIIHGWQGAYDEDSPVEYHNNAQTPEQYWFEMVQFLNTAEGVALREQYDVYFYRYPSFKRIAYNGRKLGELINQVGALKNHLDQGGKLSMLGHSMGGLVARSMLEQHGVNTVDQSGNVTTVYSGSQILNDLFTLATPHHGSPVPMLGWLDVTNHGIFDWFSNENPEWFSNENPSTPGALDLYWDNYDGLVNEKYAALSGLRTGVVVDNYDKLSPFYTGVPFSGVDKVRMISSAGNTNLFDSYYRSQAFSYYKGALYDANALSEKGVYLSNLSNPWLYWLNKRLLDEHQGLAARYHTITGVVDGADDVTELTAVFAKAANLLSTATESSLARDGMQNDSLVTVSSGLAVKNHGDAPDEVFTATYLETFPSIYFQPKNIPPFASSWVIRGADHDAIRAGLVSYVDGLKPALYQQIANEVSPNSTLEYPLFAALAHKMIEIVPGVLNAASWGEANAQGEAPLELDWTPSNRPATYSLCLAKDNAISSYENCSNAADSVVVTLSVGDTTVSAAEAAGTYQLFFKSVDNVTEEENMSPSVSPAGLLMKAFAPTSVTKDHDAITRITLSRVLRQGESAFLRTRINDADDWSGSDISDQFGSSVSPSITLPSDTLGQYQWKIEVVNIDGPLASTGVHYLSVVDAYQYDYGISGLSIGGDSIQPGQSLTLSFLLSNLGYESSTTTVYYYLSNDSSLDVKDTALGSESITLDATDTQSVSVQIDTSAFATGNYFIGACQVINGLDDSDTSNDCQAVGLAVGAARPTTQGSSPLNDTGITWGGNYLYGNHTDCSSNIDAPQDCHQGRDALSAAQLDKIGGGDGGFDFSKVAADGTLLPDSANTWACVQDNHTGLIWEVKTDDGGIHDKDNTYRWGGETAIGREADPQFGAYYDDWNTLVDGSNNESLCGYNDWRLPTREELRSIVHYGKVNPSIDSGYFPNTRAKSFWSSSAMASISWKAWGVYFYTGHDVDFSRNHRYRVRLVRSRH